MLLHMYDEIDLLVVLERQYFHNIVDHHLNKSTKSHVSETGTSSLKGKP